MKSIVKSTRRATTFVTVSNDESCIGYQRLGTSGDLTAGAAAELLLQIATGHTLVSSLAILSELYDVLQRPHIRRLHGLPDEKIRRAISRVYKLATVIPIPPDAPRVVPNDSKDDPIVMTAIAGQASVLCTLDRHLHAQEVVDLCTLKGIRILADTALLTELRKS